MSEQEAASFPDCFRIIEEKVKPQRIALASRNSSGLGRSKLWWRFSREVVELYSAIKYFDRVLVIARVSRTGAFVYVRTNQVLNEKLIVFTKDWPWLFPLLQSSHHLSWCWSYSSTLKGDLNYSQTDCFETFPFPYDVSGLDRIGKCYHDHRQKVMRVSGEGLTATYNRLHDSGSGFSEIQALRELHIQMDNAVSAAYGWSDLKLGHGFHETKQGIRFTISEAARREVLARLLKLNHERYAEEVAQGLHDKKKGKPAKAASKPKGKSSSQPSLFGEED